MHRRKFMHAALVTGAGAMASQKVMASDSKLTKDIVENDKPFNLDYAIHDGMFANHAGKDFIDQISFAFDRGFRSIEDNGMRGRDQAQQEKIGNLLRTKGMRMGVFVGHNIDWSKPTITGTDQAKHQQFLKEIDESIQVARRCNARWMTVVPGVLTNNINPYFQSAFIVDTLRKAAEMLEPHGLVMVLEPLNFRDHPNLFLTDVPQAYLICKAVNSPSCKILYDMYHAQIQVGNIIPYIDQAWDQTVYYQIGDNPGRKEPTTGEMNYKNIFRHLYNKGFKGVLGMEHGNSLPGKEGELALIKAYRESDAFL
ncbi:MAG TPA: TIM barrel protein [Flavitalea sp.]|nr:TIM barrel protein [Flavitalea sp.]